MDGAWTAAAVRRAEARLMSKVPPGTLMQRAASGLATECANLLKRRDPQRRNRAGVYGSTVIVLAGPGDNGGDALYAAARLARRGARVFAVPVMGDRVHPHAAAALTRAGGRLVSTPPQHCDLLLDGVLGIGGRPGLPGRAIDQLARIDAGVVVAVDVPSGVDVDTGAVPASAVTADVTVAFGSLKPCHVLGRAALLTGDLVLVDIGLGPYLDQPSVRVAGEGDIAAWWHRPGPDDDKYTRGVVGVAAGSERYPGAAVLATSGALAGPAGYVRYAGAAADGVRRGRPEVVCTPTVKEAGRVQAWLVGPGIGTDEAALAELRQVLVSPAPAVIDADALTLIGEYPSELSRREAPVVLTPHDREYERLYGSPPSEDRAAAAAALAKRLNCTVLLKGHHTVVAASDGTVWANPTGRPQLATAGSGDVLAGFLASLLASGMDGVHAAVTAAYLHGRAAALASEGHRTVTASDLARALPEAIGEVLARG
ncbi:NAD(P)H-hydrate dehydratase [Glycomyces sp. NPDC046736]|uniref:NAD(P)H-hydrate dehydratase n=1 Tax=Glycomyces sp. NPDC046736 TaxID=3155615 RepID=UPI0033E86C83